MNKISIVFGFRSLSEKLICKNKTTNEAIRKKGAKTEDTNSSIKLLKSLGKPRKDKRK